MTWLLFIGNSWKKKLQSIILLKTIDENINETFFVFSFSYTFEIEIVEEENLPKNKIILMTCLKDYAVGFG